MLGSGLAGLSLGLGPTPLWHAVALKETCSLCIFRAHQEKSPKTGLRWQNCKRGVFSIGILQTYF